MAASRRCSFLPLARLLLLAVVLGAVLHGEGAVLARPLLVFAEPPASPGAAGAEVILAVFAAAVVVVIFCYIRVTSTRDRESSTVGVGDKRESLGGF
ncbi:hypothetical protein BS78_01G182000 [Paspalum vaginatum]|nr:hypothetical protein BS78_01G182000 [Paspalum vaginatum]